MFIKYIYGRLQQFIKILDMSLFILPSFDTSQSLEKYQRRGRIEEDMWQRSHAGFNHIYTYRCEGYDQSLSDSHSSFSMSLNILLVTSASLLKNESSKMAST